MVFTWWRQNVIEPIHAIRIPLSRPARNAMGLVYIFAPVVAGYYIMEWTNAQASQNLGPNGQVLREKPRSAVSEMHTHHQRKQLDAILRSHKPDNE